MRSSHAQQAVPPERAPYLLIDHLSRNCTQLFTMESLVVAVTEAYRIGEAELEALVQKVACTAGDLHESTVPGTLHDDQGRRYALGTGVDPVAPENFVVRMTRHLPTEPVNDVLTVRHLVPGGRYDDVTGIGSEEQAHVLDAMVTSAALMLETLQQWIENRLYSTLEELGKQLSDGVYTVLDELDTDRENRRIDVAIVGQRRGWRVARSQLLRRAMATLRRSKGHHEADILAATFVATIMPRADLLMAQALDAHSAVVLPFKNASYVLTGSYFGLACQLLDGNETDRIHPIYDSDAIGVVLIYPAADVELQRLVETRTPELRAFVGANLRPFVQALSFIQGRDPREEPGDIEGTGARLIAVIDEVTEANRERPEARRMSLTKLRPKRRGRRRSASPK